MQEMENGQQAEAEHKPDLIDLWEERDRKSKITTFFRTSGFIMRRNGRLADHLDLHLSHSHAKRFRWAVLVPVFVVLGISLLPLFAAKGGAHIWPEMKDLVDTPDWVLVTLPAATALMALLQWGLWTGMVSWFFGSRELSPRQRNTAAALAYYLSAPLILLVVPVALGAHNTAREMADSAVGGSAGAGLRIPAWVIGVTFICVMVYWLQMILFAARDVLRRRTAGLVATAVALPILWLVSGVMVWLLPASVMIWLFMYYSLAV